MKNLEHIEFHPSSSIVQFQTSVTQAIFEDARGRREGKETYIEFHPPSSIVQSHTFVTHVSFEYARGRGE